MRDLKQPLLLNRAKKSKQEVAATGGNGGANGNGKAKTHLLCLIPELCFITGLSANLKDDFAVKKVTKINSFIEIKNLKLKIKRI